MDEATALIHRYCKQGDQTAFRRFYQQESPRLWRFLVARGCEPEQAYDVVADAFMRFVTTICRDPAYPRAFLYRIALNAHIDQRRKASSHNHVGESALDELIADHPDPDLTRDVRTAMSHLYPDEQNLLLLRYWIGLSHAEIAAVLTLPAGTVRRQAAAAQNKLRTLLGDEEDEDEE
jgi:RNA polymerase sigma factor (sigma-70 family)